MGEMYHGKTVRGQWSVDSGQLSVISQCGQHTAISFQRSTLFGRMPESRVAPLRCALSRHSESCGADAFWGNHAGGISFICMNILAKQSNRFIFINIQASWGQLNP
jgi:hypothetical protein